MRWLDSITNSVDMNLGKFQETVENKEAWRATVHGVVKSQTRLGDWTAITTHAKTQLNPNVLGTFIHKNKKLGEKKTINSLTESRIGNYMHIMEVLFSNKMKLSILHNSQKINPRKTYNNPKHICTQQRSTSIYKANVNGYIRRNWQKHNKGMFNTPLTSMDGNSIRKHRF